MQGVANMPKQVYVRGHYRKTRGSSKNPLWLFAFAACILLLWWVANDWVSFTVVLCGVICCAVLIIILRRQHKRRIIIAPVIQPALQSRYIPEDMKRFVMRRDNYQCSSCGSELYPEIDHIIPFSL